MNAIVCPNLFFINNSNWSDVEKRELFLENLTTLVDYIVENNINVLWSAELDNLLWMQPTIHPWLDRSNVSIIVKLEKYFSRIETSTPCNSAPDIVTDIIGKDVISPFLGLIHSLIKVSETASFIVDNKNNHSFTFSCGCHRKLLTPDILFIFDKFINISEEVDEKWCEIKNDLDVFTSLLELTRSKYFSSNEFVYTPEYESSFIRSVYKMTEQRERLLYKIALRLTLSSNVVSSYKGMHDEVIKENKRSFRVDGVCRVYYTYKENNIMLFKEYTGESEHDKGTRHT